VAGLVTARAKKTDTTAETDVVGVGVATGGTTELGVAAGDGDATGVVSGRQPSGAVGTAVAVAGTVGLGVTPGRGVTVGVGWRVACGVGQGGDVGGNVGAVVGAGLAEAPGEGPVGVLVAAVTTSPPPPPHAPSTASATATASQRDLCHDDDRTCTHCMGERVTNTGGCPPEAEVQPAQRWRGGGRSSQSTQSAAVAST
jgi:hypothetical protein